MINKNIAKYINKKDLQYMEIVEKTFDGYEIVLIDGYYFTVTDTTMIIEPTIKDLKNTIKQGISIITK